MAVVTLETLLIIAAVALLPPILFAGAIAAAKRYRKEPLSALVIAFLWGAIFAAGLSSILNIVVTDSLTARYRPGEAGRFLILALLVAPIVEEATKAMAVPLVRRNADEPVDGLIYGAVAGLGFATTENFFYGLEAFIANGQSAWILSAAARTFSSTLLHATATALTGYGIARALSGRGTWFGVVAWFLAAVLLHSLFNFLATIGAYFGLLGVIPAVLLALWGFGRVRRSIATMSMVAPTHAWQPVDRGRELRTWQPVSRHDPPRHEWGPPPPSETRPRWQADRSSEERLPNRVSRLGDDRRRPPE